MTTKLFTDSDFDAAKPTDLLAFRCEYCDIVFHKTKRYLTKSRGSSGYPSYCSRSCGSSIAPVHVKCANCGAGIERTPSEIRKSKSGNSFCSQSCAATYNNVHRTTGTTRSKLEVYLEEELSRLYHDLEIVYNDKLVIGSELDIYIPSLRLAFEINGIYHYEPIHGQSKLDSITVNDSHKFRDCLVNDISLCVIDTSRQKRFTVKSSAEYLRIICDIINLSGQDSNLQAVVAELPTHDF